MKTILFSTHCPRCRVLEAKLKQKGIEYEEHNDVEEMLALGLKSAPGLSVHGGPPMNFTEALAWLKTQEATHEH